tara:strand:- start:519 stop:698 length:180 start_codon:yes stop_codon:yes gene_type:complete
MQNELKDMVFDSLETLETRNEINPLKVKKIRDDYSLGKIKHRKIWHLVSLEQWFRSFID